MSLAEYLSNCTPEELREKLLLLDKSLSELYTHGYFLNGSLLNIKLGEEGELSLESFQHMLEKVNLYDDIEDNNYDNGKKSNILELCVIGICAYNNQNIMYASSRDFFRNLLDNLELYLNNDNINERIDDDIKEYYRTTLNNFVNGKELDGMNSYLVNKNAVGKGNSMVLVKATAVGKALDNKEAAFANILIIPSILVLIYLVLLIGYFLLK